MPTKFLTVEQLAEEINTKEAELTEVILEDLNEELLEKWELDYKLHTE